VGVGLTLAGVLNPHFGVTAGANDRYTIIALTAHGSGGTFTDSQGNDLPEGAHFTGDNGQLFGITYRANPSRTQPGNDVALFHVNVPAMIQDAALTPAIDEGDTATLSGRLVDPDSQDVLTLTVDWGDSSPVEVFHPGRQPFQVTHRYLDNPPGDPAGSYTVRFSWTDGHGVVRSDSRTITVRNVAPAVDAGGDAVLDGPVLNRTGSFADPGDDTWTATVDYGDGDGPGPLDLRPGRRFHLHHAYRRPGAYRVTVTVRDKDGGVGSASFLVTVDAALGGADRRPS
jgi:hypothetical protein